MSTSEDREAMPDERKSERNDPQHSHLNCKMKILLEKSYDDNRHLNFGALAKKWYCCASYFFDFHS